MRETTLVAQRFDPESGELSGEPIPVADGLGVSSVGLAEFSVAREGVLAYRAFGGEADELVAFDRGGERDGTPIESGLLNHPAFSPDGRWLAFQSDESGRAEVYVQPYPGPGRKWQVSTAGGSYPIWSPSGREIFYRDADQRLTRVEVQAGASFDAGVPEPLFELRLGGGDSLRKIAIRPDGERFVAVVPPAQRTAPPTNLIVGWDASLPAP